LKVVVVMRWRRRRRNLNISHEARRGEAKKLSSFISLKINKT
jgi:hypothetical protein